MEATGYPTLAIGIILLIGIPLALLRPFAGFIFSVGLIAAGDMARFTLTRTDILGPYFNAHDATLVVALVATVSHAWSNRQRVAIPGIALAMVAIVVVAYGQSVLVERIDDYFALRALRWAMTLPAYIFMGATFATSEERIETLMYALFWGSVLSGIQHIAFAIDALDALASGPQSLEELRNMAFRSPGIWLLLAGAVWLPRPLRIPIAVAAAGGGLFAASIFLNQTRSIWISFFATVPIIMLFFSQAGTFKRVFRLLMVGMAIALTVTVVIAVATPEVRMSELLSGRLDSLLEEDTRYLTTITRATSIERELFEWMEGSLVLGRGLYFFQPFYSEGVFDDLTVAWGHVGHITILSQLGLVGLVIYSIALPAYALRWSLLLWSEGSAIDRFLGLLCAACTISTWILFCMSDSFINQNHAAEAIIFGAAWSRFRYYQVTRPAEELSISEWPGEEASLVQLDIPESEHDLGNALRGRTP